LAKSDITPLLLISSVMLCQVASFDPPGTDPENPYPRTNMKWTGSDDPLRRYGHL